MTRTALLIWALLNSALLTSCSDYYYSNVAQADSYPTEPNTTTQPFGNNPSTGQLSESQIRDLLYLDFSNGQSARAIKRRFGLPKYREGRIDYYQMPNGHYIAIYYNSRNIAIDYGIGDSQ